jgi:hypothetical protein
VEEADRDTWHQPDQAAQVVVVRDRIRALLVETVQ